MTSAPAQAPSPDAIRCLICGVALTMRLARSRKTNKPSVMLVCGRDGRHFRAFITDKAYVGQVLARLERLQ